MLRERLLNRSWVNGSAHDRAELIARFCSGYVLFPLSQHAPTTFRARTNEDGRLFQHIDELMAPPPGAVKKAGRMNRAGQPTLYLGSQPFAAISEIQPDYGAMVSVVGCRTRLGASPMQIAPVAMTRLRTTPRLGPTNELNRSGPLGYQPFRDMLLSRGLLDQWCIQDATLGELLTKSLFGQEQEALYDITNGVRDHLYREWPGYEGVRYPSTTTSLTALNTALDKARWADIEPLNVWVVDADDEVFSHGPGQTVLFSKSLIKMGVVQPNGKIEYSNTDASFLTVLADFKQKHGRSRAPQGLEPILVNPYVRTRISYGMSPERKIYDFMST